jgi:hypothetical protein
MFGSLKCGKGDVSILYKKDLAFSVKKLEDISDERI